MAELKTYTFKIANRFIKPEAIITASDGHRKKIRYVEGEPTLDPDKQSKFAVPKRIYIANRRFMTSDPLLQQFLELRPDFTKGKDSNIKSYWIEDRQAFAMNSVDLEEQKLDVKNKIRNTQGVDLISSAYLLIGENAFTLSEAEVRAKLYALADKKTQQVAEAFDNNLSKFQIFIATAIYKNIIEIPVGATTINWYNGNEIFSVEKGQDVKEEFAKYLSTQKGNSLQQEIAIKLQSKSPTLKVEDNFLQLEGVGEKTAKNLYLIGYSSFENLASTTDEQIQQRAREKGVKLGTANFESIIEKAREKLKERANN